MPTLNWIGKDKILNHHKDVPFCVLDRKYSYDSNGMHEEDNNSPNMVIHGDNLAALKALLPQYQNKIDLIYIDPPYNTGEENWIYNDNVNDPIIKKWIGQVVGTPEEDFTRDDKWLCMMYPRLRLLSNFLSQRGAIFISIDDYEFSNLKLICDEIFGSSHFLCTIVWQKRYSRENRECIGDAHDYILVYVKNKSIFKEVRNLVEMSEKKAKVYKNPNNDPKGRWRPVPLTAQAGHATEDQFYPITAPKGKIHYPPEGRCWSVMEDTYKQLLAEGRIYFGKNNNSQPNLIRYLSEVDGIVPWTWWPQDEVGHTDGAKKEIMKILGRQVHNITPKPSTLIERIIHIATGPDSIVMDSYAGSGTTAHAVMKQNAIDGGNRKFICIEMMDYADTVTAERIKRVIAGYADVDGLSQGTFSYYELGQPILINGLINESIDTELIRQYVYYSETGSTYSTSSHEKYYLGCSDATAYYFCYEKDRTVSLNDGLLSILKPGFENYVVYADVCYIPDAYLKEHNIVFKKIPRDLGRL